MDSRTSKDRLSVLLERFRDPQAQIWGRSHTEAVFNEAARLKAERDDYAAKYDKWMKRALKAESSHEPPVVIGSNDYDQLLVELENISNYEPDFAQDVISHAIVAIRDLVSVASRAAQPPAVKCEWGYDAGDDVWQTACGQMHVFMDRGPAENDHKFCPYCGKDIDDLSRPSPTKESE